MLFAKMIDQPMKANKWLSSMRHLFAYAIKRKLLVVNPAADIKRRKPKVYIGADGRRQGHSLCMDSRIFQQAMPTV